MTIKMPSTTPSDPLGFEDPFDWEDRVSRVDREEGSERGLYCWREQGNGGIHFRVPMRRDGPCLTKWQLHIVSVNRV